MPLKKHVKKSPDKTQKTDEKARVKAATKKKAVKHVDIGKNEAKYQKRAPSGNKPSFHERMAKDYRETHPSNFAARTARTAKAC